MISRLARTVSCGLIILLPFFAASYSPISLLSANIGDVNLSDGSRVIVFVGGLSIVVLLISRVLLGDLSKASFLATFVMLLIMSYGHIYNVLKPASIGTVILGRHRFLLPLAVAALAAVGTLVWRNQPMDRRLLAATSAIMFVLLMWAAYPQIAQFFNTDQLRERGQIAEGPSIDFDSDIRPDIYYIILDGHARSDVLDSTFGYNSQEFSHELERMGFFIADASLANYGWTALSLASSLNMTYLDELVLGSAVSATDIGPAREMISESEVVKIFRKSGYSIVSFESGAQEGISDSDIYLEPNYSETDERPAILRGLSLNPFEGMLLETTLGRVLFEWFVAEQQNARSLISDFNYKKHRERIIYQLTTLPEFASRGGDFFIFAHVMSPHPPFVFGPNGEEIVNSGVYSLTDLGCCDDEEYRARYRDQVSYIDKLLLQVIGEILDASDTPPIILIQGDHGPSLNMDEGNSSPEGRFERMAIVNAYLLPEDCVDVLYPDISPVNSFRVVFECLGADADLLTDHSNYSGYWTPYEFITVQNP